MIKVKKRELIDRSASEITEESRPKKLKLIIRERTVQTLLDDLDKTTDSNITIILLFELANYFPLKPKDSEDVFNKFFQIFRSKEVDVRLKMINILRTIVQSNWVIQSEIEPFSTLILETLLEEDNEECKAHFVNLLQDFHVCLSCESKLYQRLYKETKKLLSSDFWQLRALAMNFLTKLCVKQNAWRRERAALKSPEHHHLMRQSSRRGLEEEKVDFSIQDLESILIKSTDDWDERVRITAVENLIFLDESNFALSVKSYESFCSILNDPCPTVRLHLLHLIRIMAKLYGETQVPGPNKNAEIRLVDDAFSKLCNSVHDLSVDVCTEAAKLLGTMLNVSEKFLEQTLDKKLMSKLKYLKTAEQKSSGNLLSEWATGRKFGEDAPVEKLDEDSTSLIPSGACGAFVTGLEDEHMAVRNASIDAVCHLSKQSSSFANKAMDFLADMFNDEIEDVRLNAIKSLKQLCQHIVLKEDQMETILNALDDASYDSREALRELLSSCTLYSVSCLKLTVEALMNNLKRYSHDKSSIWECMKQLGLNHPTLVQPLVLEYLNYHPFLDTPEPLIDDPFYVSKLVLVLNAAGKCSPIKALFLPHTWRHYQYLKHSNEQLVPNLDTKVSPVEGVGEKNENLVRDLLCESEKSLKLALSLNSQAKTELLQLTLKNFERLCEYQQEFKAKSEFLNLVCGTLLTFNKTLSNVWPLKEAQKYKILKELLMNTYKMKYLWKISEFSSEFNFIVDLRFRIVCELFRTNYKWVDLFKFCLDEFVNNYPFENVDIKKKFSEIKETVNNDNFSICLNDIFRFFDTTLIRLPDVDNDIKFTSVVITEPDNKSERVLRFVAGLVASVTFSSVMKNFSPSDLSNIRIRVTYPDQRQRLQTLRSRDMKKIDETSYRLRTNVYISDEIYTDVSNLNLDIVTKLADSNLFPPIV